MTKKRKQYTSLEKIEILRRHLLEGVSVSDLCDQYNLQPTVFYRWQKQLFEQGLVVFEQQSDAETKQLKSQITRLEEKVRRKDEVLGELMEEYVALKKRLGHLERRLGIQGGSRSGGRVDQDMVGENRDQRATLHRLVGDKQEQVLCLATSLWTRESTQWPDSSDILAGGLGEARHNGILSQTS